MVWSTQRAVVKRADVRALSVVVVVVVAWFVSSG